MGLFINIKNADFSVGSDVPNPVPVPQSQDPIIGLDGAVVHFDFSNAACWSSQASPVTGDRPVNLVRDKAREIAALSSLTDDQLDGQFTNAGGLDFTAGKGMRMNNSITGKHSLGSVFTSWLVGSSTEETQPNVAFITWARILTNLPTFSALVRFSQYGRAGGNPAYEVRFAGTGTNNWAAQGISGGVSLGSFVQDRLYQICITKNQTYLDRVLVDDRDPTNLYVTPSINEYIPIYGNGDVTAPAGAVAAIYRHSAVDLKTANRSLVDILSDDADWMASVNPGYINE